MYAITASGYRAVTAGMPLMEGETLVAEIPASLQGSIDVDQARVRRDQYLRDTDWTQMADAPLSAAQKAAMGVYRQQLRDLPALPGFPDVAWPTLPTIDGAAGGMDPVLIP